MRAISQYRDYGGPVAREEDKMVLANGKEQILTSLLMVEPFNWGFLSDFEYQKALEHWPNLRGLTEGENLRTRFSVFDSFLAQTLNGWSDEDRILAEQALMSGPGAGSDYFILEEVRAPKPWPTYDKIKVRGQLTPEKVAEKIAATVTELGLDIESVSIYERENLNRPEVVTALNALQAEKPAEELIQA